MIFRFCKQFWIVDRLRPMRIVNVRDREVLDRNFAARRPGFAVKQGAAGRARRLEILP
jgi:hypothetical protein